MSFKLPAAALALGMIVSASLADANGWFRDTLAGSLLDQAAIIVTGVAAEAVLPGSGRILIDALEAWWIAK